MYSDLRKRRMRRKRRAYHVRNRVRGEASKPRLTVFKSNRHCTAQIIDDETGRTLACLGTLSKALKGTELSKKSKTSAREIGKKLGEAALKENIERVVFDRGRYKFHGVIAELAEGAREAGLQF